MPFHKVLAEIIQTYYFGVKWILALDVVAFVAWVVTYIMLDIPRPRKEQPLYWAFIAVAFVYLVSTRALGSVLNKSWS